MKIIFLFLFVVSSLLAGDKIIMPTFTLKADGGVTDMVYKDKKLYVATSAGIVDIFNTQSKKLEKKITVAKIKDFMGDDINAKIYSVDVLKNRVLLLAQGMKGYREVYIYENNKLIKIIDMSDKLSIAKAKFIDNENIFFALLSNDIVSYNIKTKKMNWTTQASQSKFSNFALNEDRTEVVIADESGDLHLYNIQTAKLLKTLSGKNLDNIFAVDFKNNTIATAGQDRRTVIYNLDLDSAYYQTSHFLIYGVGLSPSAKLAAYSSDEKNNVTVFKTATKSKIGVFGGNKMTLTKILFISEDKFFVSTGDRVVDFYTIK